MLPFLLFSILFFTGKSKIYFEENVDNGFHERWVKSSSSAVSKIGELKVVKSEHEEGEYFVKTVDDSSHYQYGSLFKETLDTEKNNLVFQFVVYHTQELDCGGAYLKLLAPGVDYTKFDGDTNYQIMFGPDFCGYSTRKIHFIVNHGGKNHQITKEIPVTLDKEPHLFTLVLYTNKTFVIKMDNVVKRNGTILDEFSILPPKTIPDPAEKKPDDWVDEETIVDTNDKKPDDWIDEKTITDPEAKKPEDWNDETEGEWQADVIPNPQYKGEWEPKKIPNPSYKGPWKAKEIANPDYKEDDTICNFHIGSVGLEIWQVRSGTQFDQIFVSDDVDEAEKHAAIVMERIKEITDKIRKAQEAEKAKMIEDAKEKRENKNDENDKADEEEEIDGDDELPEKDSHSEDKSKDENDEL